VCSLQGISDGVSLVQAVVPKNQAHSFITQGSPDVLVSKGELQDASDGCPWDVSQLSPPLPRSP